MSVDSDTAVTPTAVRGARKFERLDTVVEVSISSDNTFWTGLTHNVSKGGLFVVTDAPLPLGTMLSFRLSLDGRRAVDVRGVVRWVRGLDSGDDDLPPGMGVQFTTLDRTTERAIEAFIQQRRESLYFDTDDDL
jgi:type IV pilus assembly protein PilZ